MTKRIEAWADRLCFIVVLGMLAATVVGLLGWFVLLSAYL